MFSHLDAIRSRVAAVALLCLPFILDSGAVPGQTEPPREAEGKSHAVEFESRNLNFRFSERLAVEIRYLRGRMVPLRAGEPVTFDDVASFEIVAESAVVALTPSALTTVLNDYAFAYEGAPLKDLKADLIGDQLRISGHLHKGVVLPFVLQGRPQATPEGQIRMHADKISSVHLPVKSLLHLFGEDLAKLVNTNEAKGVRIDGDDILLFPDRLLPAPHIHGKVTHVAVENGRIVQTFGSGRPLRPLSPPRKAANYVYHRGGELRFGKLTMTDADLEIIDVSPADPFDFFLGQYNRQLVAGYSKNTPSHGLVVFMPDYHRLPAARH